jgi:hypothetical protein
MTHTGLPTVALTAATLIAATPALAGNAGGTPGKALQIEQLGPKHLLGAGSPRTPSTTPATRTIPVTLRTLEVEELGPKYLLGSVNRPTVRTTAARYQGLTGLRDSAF